MLTFGTRSLNPPMSTRFFNGSTWSICCARENLLNRIPDLVAEHVQRNDLISLHERDFFKLFPRTRRLIMEKFPCPIGIVKEMIREKSIVFEQSKRNSIQPATCKDCQVRHERHWKRAVANCKTLPGFRFSTCQSV